MYIMKLYYLYKQYDVMSKWEMHLTDFLQQNIRKKLEKLKYILSRDGKIQQVWDTTSICQSSLCTILIFTFKCTDNYVLKNFKCWYDQSHYAHQRGKFNIKH